MLESIRTPSTTTYSPIDSTSSRVLPVMTVPGTEHPDEENASQAVQALDKGAAATRAAEHPSHTQLSDSPRESTRPAKSDDAPEGRTHTHAARPEREAEKSADTQSTEEALKDPTSEVYQLVQELSARDQEVRAHEQAHLAVAGAYATSGAQYTFQTGPDGKRYAIGGEVGIDTAVVPDDPHATVSKMQTVQRAAMAPAEPSAQDIRVAADAAQKAAQARMDIMRIQLETRVGGEESDPSTDTATNSTDALENRDSDDTVSHTAQNALTAYQSATAQSSEPLALAA